MCALHTRKRVSVCNVCVSVHAYECVCEHMLICVWVCVWTYVCECVPAWLCVCLYACVFVFSCWIPLQLVAVDKCSNTDWFDFKVKMTLRPWRPKCSQRFFNLLKTYDGLLIDNVKILAGFYVDFDDIMLFVQIDLFINLLNTYDLILTGLTLKSKWRYNHEDPSVVNRSSIY
jgi:hypothetical protein